MPLLHYISYVAAVAAFLFVTLSLASGLLYISELIEEHARLAKLIGQRATYAVVVLHLVLCATDALPLPQTAFSVACHWVYLQNFSSRWPLISLASPSFLASCLMAVVNHFLWFVHFSRLARDARQTYRHRPPASDAPRFTDIATFFGLCVWLVPLFLFLSLSANDNALPTSSDRPVDPAAARPSKSSLFKSLLSVVSKDKVLPDKSAGTFPAYPFPSPSPSPLHSPLLSPSPRSPKSSSHPTARLRATADGGAPSSRPGHKGSLDD